MLTDLGGVRIWSILGSNYVETKVPWQKVEAVLTAPSTPVVLDSPRKSQCESGRLCRHFRALLSRLVRIKYMS